MSTLEKTIDLLHALTGNQVEVIYSFVQFLSSQQETEKPPAKESLDDIFKNLDAWGVNAGASFFASPYRTHVTLNPFLRFFSF